jgi:hypothetical protein
VPVCPRQESSEAASAAPAAGGRGGAVEAEQSSAAPGKGGGSGRWRDEREANGSARETIRAMAVPPVVWRRERRRRMEEGFGWFVWLVQF